jgi:riboflavin biosynthesis pyrimidine reductase
MAPESVTAPTDAAIAATRVLGMGLRVLLPANTSLDAALATLRPSNIPHQRPYVLANMVTTLDGSTAIAGESGTIGAHAPGDRTVFRALRDASDAVLAGTGTLAAEGYRRLIATEERRRARVERGLAADAVAVVLSRSGRIPEGVPMLADPAQPVRAFTGADADPAPAFAALRAEGIEVLLCEGGPSLLGDLVRRGLVDELFVTIAPVLGGGAPEHTLLGGAADHPRTLQLRWLLEEGGGVHARYAMLAAGSDPRAEKTQGALPPR